MLNRRHLRIKVLQSLYAYFQSDDMGLAAGEKQLTHSLEKIYDMYIFFLTIFGELKSEAERKMEDGKNKRLPSDEDLNPNLKFINNAVINKLEENYFIQKQSKDRKINWVGEQEIVRKLFKEIKSSEAYEAYMATRINSFEEDKKFVTAIFRKIIANFELIHHYFEEKSVYWVDDIDLVAGMVIKTIKGLDEASDENYPILPLYKDEEEDKEFIRLLFRRTISMEPETKKLIDEKTKNWEIDRIAVMDIILMKMAITEAMEFSSVPLKVTMNEYIEISKFYSTPKSSVFINGILDRIISELKAEGKIKKIGRGLIE